MQIRITDHKPKPGRQRGFLAGQAIGGEPQSGRIEPAFQPLRDQEWQVPARIMSLLRIGTRRPPAPAS